MTDASQGPSREHCPSPVGTEGHAMATHFFGAKVTLDRCYLCGWMDNENVDKQIDTIVNNAIADYAARNTQ